MSEERKENSGTPAKKHVSIMETPSKEDKPSLDVVKDEKKNGGKNWHSFFFS
jgi:hypothetical protein